MVLKFLSILCIAGAIGLFGYEQMYSGRIEKLNNSIELKPDSNEKINYRLQSVDHKIKMQKLKAMRAQDNNYITETLGRDERNHKVNMIKGIDERLDNTLQDVISDLTPRNKQESLQKLEDEIQEGMEELEDLEDYNEYEREAFIKAFMENAKARGLRIRIDKNLNVYE